MRAITDLFQLIWPITGGYRLFLPYVLDRTWPVMRRAAWLHRRVIMRKTRVVTVVGSVGKTTTKRLVDAALGEGVSRHTAGNYGASLALNVLYSRPWDTAAVFEVGIAGPGRMAGYARMLRPHIVVVTAVKSDHNRSLPTLEHTREEKVKMVRALAPGGLAVLNGDDPHVRWMATQTRARVVTFGFEPQNEVRASDVQVEWPQGTRFTLHAQGQEREVRTRLIGGHLVYPVLAAVAVGLAEGVSLDELIRRAEQVAPTPQRLELIRLDSGAMILSDEFKGSLESFHAALETLAQIPAKRRIAVLGPIHEPQGSDGDVYRTLGRHAARAADRIIFIGHTKSFKALRAEAVRSGMMRESIMRVGEGVGEAIRVLRQEVRDGDVVLLKGAATQRLERIRLALQGTTVRCPATECKVRSFTCETCPLRDQPETVLENTYVRLLVKHTPGHGARHPQGSSSQRGVERACAAS